MSFRTILHNGKPVLRYPKEFLKTILVMSEN